MKDVKTEDWPLCELFGPTPQTKITIFFLAHALSDYNISEIAEYTGISRQTVAKVIPGLIRADVIRNTREVGRAAMYKWHPKSNVSVAILELNDALVELIVKEELEKDKECPNTTDAIKYVNDLRKALKKEKK